MNDNKIKIGMDLGTTNSAVAVMENDVPVIRKSVTMKDTTPSVVAITHNKVMKVGDAAVSEMHRQVMRAVRTYDRRRAGADVFCEFKRKMGTQAFYRSKNLYTTFSPEDLSAEIIKTLFATTGLDDAKCVVISVPAKFDVIQKTATMDAAKLAGFTHCALIQEPVAAAISYGATNTDKNGFWLVFDMGGGTFDAALLKVENGCQQVIDTDGDSCLGGKDLDNAVIDHILLPYIQENYNISKIVGNFAKLDMLRQALKIYAEELRVQLSNNESTDLVTDLSELGYDDDKTEIIIDMTIQRSDVEAILEPFFTRAIDICKKLLLNNGIGYDQICNLILVGGPTYTPKLRTMLREQLTENVDTSVDPMTAVVKGAALYASTLDVPTDIQDEPDADATDVEVFYESTCPNMTTWVSLKVAEDAMEEGMTVEFVRDDKAWKSGAMPYEGEGVAVELALVANKSNRFEINLMNKFGRRVKTTLTGFSIQQGTALASVTLPYQYGFGVWSEDERPKFFPFVGLEKNRMLPAIGKALGRKTTMTIRPDDATTYLRIPVYHAETYKENSPTALYEHVADVLITGKDVEQVIPAGSNAEVTVMADASEMMKFTVYFPDLGIEVNKTLDTSHRLSFSAAFGRIKECEESIRTSLALLENGGINVDTFKARFKSIQKEKDNLENKGVIEHFRALLAELYTLEVETEWQRIEKELVVLLNSIPRLRLRNKDSYTSEMLYFLQKGIELARANQDVAAANLIIDQFASVRVEIDWLDRWSYNMHYYDNTFDKHDWKDKELARIYIDSALALLKGSPSKEDLRRACQRVWNQLSRNVKEASGLLG